MKVIDSGYLYKVHNRSGMQTIKFLKEGAINDQEQNGTSLEEVCMVLYDKLNFESKIKDISDSDRDNYLKMKVQIGQFLKTI